MCGLAGLILGERQRTAAELKHLTSLFTRLLVISRQRGPHATGVAWLNHDGQHRLFKRPMPAEEFVEHKSYPLVLAGVDSRTTVLLGHTRWRTRGDEHINRNNHPIRAGHVIGTHNGTIYNADDLFRRYRLSRFADVDSEVLFRMAAKNITRDGNIDIAQFMTRLRQCRGPIAAVLASRSDPRTVLMLRGNNPLKLRWNPRACVILYASDTSYLNAVLARERGWRELPLSPMTLLALRSEDLSQHSTTALSFLATASENSPDINRLRQPWLDEL
jgi:amidophosphoribosyltransferase